MPDLPGAFRLCISVAAGDVDQFTIQAREALKHSDLVELRFDALPQNQLAAARSRIAGLRRELGGDIIATFRTSDRDQGGFRPIQFEERVAFWRDPETALAANWADIEHDLEISALFPGSEIPFERVVRSFHDTKGKTSIGELKGIARKLAEEPFPGIRSPFIIKLAAATDDIRRSAEIWAIAREFNERGLPCIGIAIGSAGEWTRVMAHAAGSPFTYCHPDSHLRTASGQPSFLEMKDLYSASSVTDRTGVYGIVGNPVEGSLSPRLQNAAFRDCGLDSVYCRFPVADLDAFFGHFVERSALGAEIDLRGFSVTRPHKTAIIAHLDRLDETARAVGAVNTVRIDQDGTTGFNTDVEGVIGPLAAALGDLKGRRVAVFGAGGAARAAVFGLLRSGAVPVVIAKRPEAARELAGDLGCNAGSPDEIRSGLEGFEIAVNATPLGSAGDLVEGSVLAPSQFKNLQLVFDMVYTPRETRLLREARNAGVMTIDGIEMLLHQAREQFRIWTGIDRHIDAFRESLNS